MILLFILYAVCAATFTISKAALCISSPLWFLAARMITGGTVLVLLCAYTLPRAWVPRSRSAWKYIAQIALWGVCVTYILDLWSLQYMPSSVSAYIYGLTPFITGIISYLVLHERLALMQWLGMGIALAGNMLLWGDSLHGISALSHVALLPALALIGAICASSYSWVIMRKAVTTTSLAVPVLNGWSMLLGGCVALCLAPFASSGAIVCDQRWFDFLALTGLIVLASNIIFSNLYGYLLRMYSATLVALAGFTCPLFATMLGWLFLGETLPFIRMFWAAVSLGIGLILFYSTPPRKS